MREVDPAYDPEHEQDASAKHRRRRRKKRSPSPPNVAFPDYDEDEQAYYGACDRDVRTKIAQREGRVREMNEREVPLRFRVLMSDVDDRVRAVAMRRVEQIYQMDPSNAEYHKAMSWVEALCALPIGKYRTLPVTAASPHAEVGAFLTDMRSRLDEGVYGHDVAKGHIVRLVAQWVTNPTAKGLVIGIHGQMGTGKTSLCKAICAVLGLPFAFVPLGGANDGTYLDGHSYTYEGAVWGKIADVLMRCGCMNPVLFFDELDKISDTSRGQEVVHKLMHMTDPSQNDQFTDRYFTDVNIDLSRSLIVFSYNEDARVNPILLDRMTRVHTEGYSLKDKLAIAREHLLPSVLSEFAMAPGDVEMPDDVVRRMIELVDEEQGVRNLRRAIVDIVSHLNMERLVSPSPSGSAKTGVVVSDAHVDKYVARPKTPKHASCGMYL
jgi:ATP-dependent Lon protease